MDWSKAKTILILALLVTNIFLVATYGTMGVKDDPVTLDQGTLIELLAARGVYLETQIPKHPKSMEVIAVEVVRSVDEEVSALLSSQGAPELFNVGDKFPPEELLNIEEPDLASAYVSASINFITALGFMDETVKFSDLYLGQGDQILVEFQNIYGGVNLQESSIVCSFSQGSLVDMDALWLKPIATNRKKVALMEPAVALLALVGEKEAEEKLRVKSIELAYWLNIEDSNLEDTVTDTVFPAWCITYNEGEKIYFTAAQI
ncbi:MAG: two-component system regulatory protein YycI [Anaerovoracaceae bacterium]|jgi:regulatory protein YycI of two-component signal transduction system YycFG|nr:two-component system regulatory protein YycI [Anaerovoracaceae bacterium]